MLIYTIQTGREDSDASRSLNNQISSGMTLTQTASGVTTTNIDDRKFVDRDSD
jgi:hypothetical protein